MDGDKALAIKQKDSDGSLTRMAEDVILPQISTMGMKKKYIKLNHKILVIFHCLNPILKECWN